MKFLSILLSALVSAVIGFCINQLPNLPEHLKPWVPAATLGLIVVSVIVTIQQEKRNAASAKTSKGNRQQGRDSSSTGDRLESLIQQVHHRCCEFIKRHHSTIKLINQQPIPVTDLYVDVYVLEDLAINRYVDLGRIDYDPEQDRLYMGTRRDAEPQDGIKIAEERDRLLVLGKPGSGKSTFLKHLAEACRTGSFCTGLIPVLIMLGNIDASQFKLLDLIQAAFGDLVDTEQTKQILKRGRVLILLDGLDEVSIQYQRSVQDEICDFSRNPDYDRNRYILTCRTHTSEYVVPGFEPPVEVADFDAPKVERFAQKWFEAIEGNPRDAELSKAFLEKLRSPEQERTAKLAVTPVLLDLVCWIYHGCEDLPSKRSDLYKTGVELLLKDLDKDKGVQRSANHPVFDRLTPTDKQNLLSHIAFRKFERSNNFRVFTQDEIIRDISEHLGLENREDSEAVLIAIAAHHGLLVERARGIWSFSHLTFQEYFVARAIVEKKSLATLEYLASKITESQWREVFLLTNQLLQNMHSIEFLFKVMQANLNLWTLAQLGISTKLGMFLDWINTKTYSIPIDLHRQVAVRAFYFEIGCDLKILGRKGLHSKLGLSGAEISGYQSKPRGYLILDSILESCLRTIQRVLFSSKFQREILTEGFYLYKENDEAYSNIDFNFLQSLRALEHELHKINIKLKNYQANELYTDGLIVRDDLKNLFLELKCLLLKHRNIGYDWQFSKEEQKKLRQYYDATWLLVDCLNSDFYMSREVKAAIEDTLLLPIKVSSSG